MTVESDIALPELADARNGHSDRGGRCSIVLGNAPADLDRTTSTPLAWARRGDACLFYRDVAVYHVTDGRRIVIEPASGADERVVRLFLLGPALAVLLHQRGLLVLHASSVSIHGQAAAFAAEKGEGKSTLAAALHARGHPLVADDVLAVDLNSDDAVRVFPGFPQLKLAPDSAAQLSSNPHELPRIHPELDKRLGPAMRGFAQEPLELGRIFILQTAGAPEAREGEAPAEPQPARTTRLGGSLALPAASSPLELRPLAPQRRFVELVRHSYLAPMLRSTGEAAQHFQQVTGLANRVPVFELRRPRNMGLLEPAAQMIETEMRRPR